MKSFTQYVHLRELAVDNFDKSVSPDTSDEHLDLIEKMVFFDKIRRQAKVSDPDIQFVIRKGKKYSYLFLLNYHNQKKAFTVNSKKYILNPFSCKVFKKK